MMLKFPFQIQGLPIEYFLSSTFCVDCIKLVGSKSHCTRL